MKLKCDKLDYQITATSQHIVAQMSFKDFEQSQRFLAMVIKFIKSETETLGDAMPDLAWHCPPSLGVTKENN